ncbi:MAG: protein-L-isoaspartate(D-aspartate) O-methyltransferase [Acidiferrobacterales bacterium]
MSGSAYTSAFLLLVPPLVVLATALGSTASAEDEPYASQRNAMIAAIEEDVILTSSATGRRRFNSLVMQAMVAVHRHEFVPEKLRPFAYENRPLPIGYGQTISQPYIVALMSELLEIDRNGVVLEVGTGSGYQAAVLADLVRKVYTIEIIQPLADQAKVRLDRLGYQNVTTRLGDGYYGWAEHAPFDGIVVTAAADHVPPPLIEQLKPGGRMVIPVGGRFFTQQLLLVQKTQEGGVTTRQVLPVRFVPLTGDH